jgi:hypothetical protein
MSGWEDPLEQHEPGAHDSTLDGWADQEPEEIQAHFEFSGYDDWEIERSQEQWQKEGEEAEERQKQEEDEEEEEEEVGWSTRK